SPRQSADLRRPRRLGTGSARGRDRTTRLDSEARRDGGDLQRQVRAPLALAAGPKARHLATVPTWSPLYARIRADRLDPCTCHQVGIGMKFFPLVWAGLWRRPLRSTLTAMCIAIAFLLLGLLEGVNAGFAKAIADAHRDFLVTNTRVRGGAPLPISAMAKIQSIPGVKEVAQRAYFMGNYRDVSPKDMVAALATQPELFFRVRPGFVVAKESLDAMRENRAGMLATPPLLENFGWKVGDAITLRSQTLKTDGSRDWTFNIVGTFDTAKEPTRAYFGIINYSYLDEYRVQNRGTAEIFYVRIADTTKAVATAAAIDGIFAYYARETR